MIEIVPGNVPAQAVVLDVPRRAGNSASGDLGATSVVLGLQDLDLPDFVTFMLGAGVRIGEALAVRWRELCP